MSLYVNTKANNSFDIMDHIEDYDVLNSELVFRLGSLTEYSSSAIPKYSNRLDLLTSSLFGENGYEFLITFYNYDLNLSVGSKFDFITKSQLSIEVTNLSYGNIS